MSETLPVTDARARFGALVRRACEDRERITITDHGHPAAVLINVHELEDLEDSLAVARFELKQRTGSDRYVSHEEAKRRLGLAPA
ncbi:MAG TPA: type II toxin-antitoxin system Phd/YefM family antitoxin [Actinopolymorphaceae bacterium]